MLRKSILFNIIWDWLNFLYLGKILFMKNILLVLPIVLFQSIAGQTLTFEYDTAGNQKVRQYCASCASHSKSVNSNLTTDGTLASQISQVKVYPNPTKDKVNLIWKPELGELITKIEYVGYNVTQSRPIPFDKREGKVILDLSDQPIGLYLVIFHLTSGEKLTYKILKH